MGLVQLLSSLGYALAAALPAHRGLISGAALFENFAAGLGTAAFLAFLMSVCERRYAATQFALLSAVYALSRWAVGVASGVLAERMGFAHYFLLTFALGIPAYGLLPWVRNASAPAEESPYLSLPRIQRATASCISRWRCHARSTGASPGVPSAGAGGRRARSDRHPRRGWVSVSRVAAPNPDRPFQARGSANASTTREPPAYRPTNSSPRDCAVQSLAPGGKGPPRSSSTTMRSMGASSRGGAPRIIPCSRSASANASAESKGPRVTGAVGPVAAVSARSYRDSASASRSARVLRSQPPARALPSPAAGLSDRARGRRRPAPPPPPHPIRDVPAAHHP